MQFYNSLMSAIPVFIILKPGKTDLVLVKYKGEDILCQENFFNYYHAMKNIFINFARFFPFLLYILFENVFYFIRQLKFIFLHVILLPYIFYTQD